jgi:hypothetical protein
MELLRKNSEVYSCVVIKKTVIHAYLGYNIVAIYTDVTAVIIEPIKQLMGIASLNQEIS